MARGHPLHQIKVSANKFHQNTIFEKTSKKSIDFTFTLPYNKIVVLCIILNNTGELYHFFVVL
jgi:hypothetical protein